MPPGHVTVRLDLRHKRAYKALYARYGTVLTGLPVLRERDFDGRAVKLTMRALDALNMAFAGQTDGPAGSTGGAFAAQERARARLFKKLQYLS